MSFQDLENFTPIDVSSSSSLPKEFSQPLSLFFPLDYDAEMQKLKESKEKFSNHLEPIRRALRSPDFNEDLIFDSLSRNNGMVDKVIVELLDKNVIATSLDRSISKSIDAIRSSSSLLNLGLSSSKTILEEIPINLNLSGLLDSIKKSGEIEEMELLPVPSEDDDLNSDSHSSTSEDSHHSNDISNTSKKDKEAKTKASKAETQTAQVSSLNTVADLLFEVISDEITHLNEKSIFSPAYSSKMKEKASNKSVTNSPPSQLNNKTDYDKDALQSFLQSRARGMSGISGEDLADARKEMKQISTNDRVIIGHALHTLRTFYESRLQKVKQNMDQELTNNAKDGDKTQSKSKQLSSGKGGSASSNSNSKSSSNNSTNLNLQNSSILLNKVQSAMIEQIEMELSNLTEESGRKESSSDMNSTSIQQQKSSSTANANNGSTEIAPILSLDLESELESSSDEEFNRMRYQQCLDMQKQELDELKMVLIGDELSISESNPKIISFSLDEPQFTISRRIGSQFSYIHHQNQQEAADLVANISFSTKCFLHIVIVLPHLYPEVAPIVKVRSMSRSCPIPISDIKRLEAYLTQESLQQIPMPSLFSLFQSAETWIQNDEIIKKRAILNYLIHNTSSTANNSTDIKRHFLDPSIFTTLKLIFNFEHDFKVHKFEDSVQERSRLLKRAIQLILNAPSATLKTPPFTRKHIPKRFSNPSNDDLKLFSDDQGSSFTHQGSKAGNKYSNPKSNYGSSTNSNSMFLSSYWPQFIEFPITNLIGDVDEEESLKRLGLTPASIRILLESFNWNLQQFSSEYLSSLYSFDDVKESIMNKGKTKKTSNDSSKDSSNASSTVSESPQLQWPPPAFTSLLKRCNIKTLDAEDESSGSSSMNETVSSASATYQSAPNLASIESCPTCMDDLPIYKFFKLECGHVQCLDCYSYYVEHLVQSNQIQKIPCPHPNCSYQVDQSSILGLLSAQGWQQYIQKMASQFISASSGWSWCPSGTGCDCVIQLINSSSVSRSNAVNSNDDSGLEHSKKQQSHPAPHGTGSNDSHIHPTTNPSINQILDLPILVSCICGYSYCSDCRLPGGHFPATCSEMGSWIAINRQQMISEDELSEKIIKSMTKECPKCHASISKSGGCPHMSCRSCCHQFCWTCAADWDASHYACSAKAAQVSDEITFAQGDPKHGFRAMCTRLLNSSFGEVLTIMKDRLVSTIIHAPASFDVLVVPQANYQTSNQLEASKQSYSKHLQLCDIGHIISSMETFHLAYYLVENSAKAATVIYSRNLESNHSLIHHKQKVAAAINRLYQDMIFISEEYKRTSSRREILAHIMSANKAMALSIKLLLQVMDELRVYMSRNYFIKGSSSS